jgi:outer membrane immunogenic protein
MITTKFRYACGLAALTCSTAAFAQQEGRYFDGFYISGAVGTEFAEDSSADSIAFDTNRDGTFDNTVRTGTGANAFAPGFCAGSANAAASATCRGNGQNEGYAVRIGVDKHLGGGPLVAGLLVEGARPGVQEFTTGFSSTPASYTFGREIDWAVTARARAGFAPGEGRALFYGTGGAGFARIDHSFETTNGANSFTPDNERDWKFGWQAGGGAEVMLARNLGLGLEYLYSSYKDNDYTVAVGPGSAPVTNPFLLENAAGTDLRLSNDRFNFHSVRGTVSLRF